jgi:diguanylate cyclase (GGDEF)-like protein
MPCDNDKHEIMLKLLSSRELSDCLSTVGQLILDVTCASGAAVMIWDADMESFAQQETFGEKRKRMISLCDEFVELFDELDKNATTLNLDSFSSKVEEAFETVTITRLEHEGELCAIVFVADPNTPAGVDPLAELTAELPLSLVVYNAWCYSELELENERLRSQYEEMEDKTAQFEEQTRKLIHDLTARDSIRIKQVERERLVYWISNLVRSSVRIQEVLATIVEKICTTWSLSRTLVLRADKPEKFEVYEYHIDKVATVKDEFSSPQGLDFARIALDLKAPQYIDPEVNGHEFNLEFLNQIGTRAGLIIPLVVRDRVLGAVFLQDCMSHREWSIDDISLIGSLCDQCALAIENAELHMEIERQAVTDGLTGVANRRSFNESLSKEFERAKRYGQPLSLAVIDLDFLKKINDTYGHMTGDEAIKAIGTVLQQSSRSIDITARYGGEEFCVLLPNTDIDMAEQLAERLRRLIRETEIDGPGALSASIGVASFPLHADGADALFLRADEALYRAKQDGRNKVKVSTLGPDGEVLGPMPPKPDSTQNLLQEKS